MRTSDPPLGPPQAEIVVDTDAIRDNVAALAARAGANGAEVMAVVKADGYGHGMLPSAWAALDGGATWLGVATVDEALALRAAGLTVPVLAWLIGPGQRLVETIEAGVDVSVSSTVRLGEVVAAAVATGAVARLHLKVDTGLGRSGATAADWPDLVAAAVAAQATGAVEVVGVWSHFAYADAPGHPTIAGQVAAFKAAVAAARAGGLTPPLLHLANSAATLTLPDAHFDLVRPGLAVYGLSPVPQVDPPAAFGLRPAMRSLARVALVKRLPAGHGVSYGHRYHTPTETSVALIPVGYADGIPRAGTNCGPVLVGGRRRTVAGTVCMDQFMVDVGDDPVAEGDEVVLFGAGDRKDGGGGDGGGDAEPTAQDWADAVGTISYEIVTRVGTRVPRRWTGAAGRVDGAG